MTSWRQ